MISRRSVLAGIGALPVGARLLISRSWAQSASTQFDYYIGPAGNDSNPGTQSQPWSISAINSKWSTYAGKRVGLLDGTYDLTSLPSTGYTVKLAIVSGTVGSPTVIQSVNPRKAVLSCNTSSGSYASAPIIGNGDNGTGSINYSPQYITIKDLTITGGNTSGVSFAGVKPNDSPGLVVDGCEIYNIVNPNNNGNIGCIKSSTGPIGLLVNNCHLHDCYTAGQSRSSHGNSSGIHSYDNGMTVQYTTIHDCNNAIYQKNQAATPPPDGMTIRNCYIWAGTSGMGPALAGFNNALGTAPPYQALNVYNNVFENVYLYYDANDGVSGLQAPLNLYNNTVYATGASGLGHWTPTAAAVVAGVRVSVYNNILVRGSVVAGWGDLTLGPVYGAWAVCDYNCYPSSPQFGITTADSTYPAALIALAQWLGVTGAPDAHSLTTNPGFVGPLSAGIGAQQYQLPSRSPCRGAGRVGGNTSGAVMDMGAWAGVTSIGHNFGPVPAAPILSVS